jgi:hypothetical protein
VALAVQNVLGDLFASLSIVLDKPFVVGDSITVGDTTGTVEYIGVKTTRLRALTGEQIVFSNAEMLKSAPVALRRVVAGLRRGVPRDESGIRGVHGHPAVDLPEAVRPVRRSGNRVRLSDQRRQTGRRRGARADTGQAPTACPRAPYEVLRPR